MQEQVILQSPALEGTYGFDDDSCKDVIVSSGRITAGENTYSLAGVTRVNSGPHWYSAAERRSAKKALVIDAVLQLPFLLLAYFGAIHDAWEYANLGLIGMVIASLSSMSDWRVFLDRQPLFGYPARIRKRICLFDASGKRQDVYEAMFLDLTHASSYQKNRYLARKNYPGARKHLLTARCGNGWIR